MYTWLKNHPVEVCKMLFVKVNLMNKNKVIVLYRIISFNHIVIVSLLHW